MMIWPLLIQTFIVVGTSFMLSSGFDIDISPDASVLFQNAAVSGRAPRCQLLRREPRNRPAYVMQVLTKPENTTARFPLLAAVLNQDVNSLAAMISLLIDEHSLPATRSFVNVLLTNQATANKPSQQFLLSQNFKVTSPYLKVTGGAVDALSVKTLQLNMLVPMTGLDYSLAPTLEQMKSSPWTMASLPAGDYAVEVQIARSDNKGKGGSNLRAGGWLKVPSVGAGAALDQATLRRGDDVMGCLRLEQTFSLPWIEVDHRVTDSMPLILDDDGRESDWFAGRSGNASEPFVAGKSVFVFAKGQSYFAEDANVPRIRYDNVSLTVVNIIGSDMNSCDLRLGNQTTVPFIITGERLATFKLPAFDSGCGQVRFRVEYVYPDQRHRIVTDVDGMAVLDETGTSMYLADLMNAENDVTDRLIVGLAYILQASQSLVELNSLGSEGTFVREAVMGATNTSSFQSFLAMWNGRLDMWNVTQIFADTLVDAQTALFQVLPYTTSDASNSTNYIYTDHFTETDDFFEGTDDYFSRNISAIRRLSEETASVDSCYMGVFVRVLDALNTAFVKLLRSMVTVRESIVQLQRLRNKDPAVSSSDIFQDLLAANGSVPDALVEPLIRLYAQMLLVEVLAKDVQRLTARLVVMKASGCNVPCLSSETIHVATEVACDSFVYAPLMSSMESFTIRSQGCAAEWYPMQMRRINAVLNSSSMPVMDMSQWLPADVYVESNWLLTVQELLAMRMPSSRVTAPVRYEMMAIATAPALAQPYACSAASKNGGREAVLTCGCVYLTDYDNLQPLTIHADYVVSRQSYDHLGRTSVVVPMTRTKFVTRPPSIYVGMVNNTESFAMTGEYAYSPVPDLEETYQRYDLQYVLVLRRGRPSCPKGEWGVVPTSVAWKKYADPSVPWNNATDVVVAQFHDCFFHSNAEKQAFSISQSYDITQLDITPGYVLQFHF